MRATTVLIFVALSRTAWALPSEEAACPSTRWVGKSTSPNGCPQAAAASSGRWAARRQFATNVDFAARLPEGLNGYCVYEWTPSVGTAALATTALPRDGERPAWQWLALDCLVTSQQTMADYLALQPKAAGLAERAYVRQL